MEFAPAFEGFAAERMAPRRRWRFGRWLVHHKIALLCVIYLAIFYGCGVIGPFVAPYDPNQQTLSVEARRATPSSDHIFGTDALGRDIFSRVLYAARTTIIFTVLVVITGEFLLGLGLGLLAGYRGGWVDTLIMRVGEVLSAVPTLILMLAITAAFRLRINDISFWLEDNTPLGQDAPTVVRFLIIVGVTIPFSWLGSARIIRGQILSLREHSYITAAESIGASTSRIIWRHLFPGILPLFVVSMSSTMAGIAGSELALSYLGLGVSAPASSFGGLISDSQGVATFQNFPHLLLASAGPVALFLYAWNLLGDALVDYFSPRVRSE
jgi:ABC-type dipeptide/oligopeptide/nickel transport system permease subunit